MTVHSGGDPENDPVAIRYAYDDGGRLASVTNENASVEYGNYDFLGRPRLSREVRYANASGLESPLKRDVYTQTRRWNEFDEISRWSLPVAGASGPTEEIGEGWRTWIDEEHDAAGNLTRQRVASSPTGPADGETIDQSFGRGVGRLAARTRLPGSTGIGTTYGYADGNLVPVPNVEFPPENEIASPVISGLLRRATTSVGSLDVAGSYNARDDARRVSAVYDLGVGNRESIWTYDGRGRLGGAVLGSFFGQAASNAGIAERLSPADFRSARTQSPPFSPSELENLGDSAWNVARASWTASEASAHRIESRTLQLSADMQRVLAYGVEGGRRTTSAGWTASYDAFDRLVSVESGSEGRRIEYLYDPMNRVIGRVAYQKSESGEWSLETRTNVLARDGLPADSTFVWDPVTDRLVAVFQSGMQGDGTGVGAGLVRQFIHGDQGYDDPVELLVADVPGGTPRRFYPLLDEAGTGSVQAVLNADGTLAERALFADSYGDAPRYLQGPVVDRITIEAEKDSTGLLSRVTFRVHLSEKIDPATLAAGLTLDARDDAGTTLGSAPTEPAIDEDDPYAIDWSVDGDEWNATFASAASVRVAVTNLLRASAWGNVAVMPAPAWAQTLYGVESTSATPVARRESVANLATFFDSISADSANHRDLYAIPDLYLAASADSKTNLLTGFKAAPFVEPATGLAYFRARWYDPSTGTFLTPDPMGYVDSSDLYAFAAGDPVNRSDPTGEFWSAAVDIGFTVWDAYECATGAISSTQCAVRMSLNAASLTADVFTGGFGGGVAVRAVGLAGRAGRVGEVVVHGAILVDRANIAVSGVQSAVSVYEALETGNYTRAALSTVQVGLSVHSLRNTEDIALLTARMRSQPWSPTYGQAFKVKDPAVVPPQQSHHIIQDAAAETAATVPGRSNYSYSGAPATNLAGGSASAGSQHDAANEIQRLVPMGGTYGAERNVGWLALRAAGYSRGSARSAIKRADRYFIDALGWTKETVLTIPGTRP